MVGTCVGAVDRKESNIMWKRKLSSCEKVDAFAILTRQGVVLLSDDAKLTRTEDDLLYAINQNIKMRKERNNGKR